MGSLYPTRQFGPANVKVGSGAFLRILSWAGERRVSGHYRPFEADFTFPNGRFRVITTTDTPIVDVKSQGMRQKRLPGRNRNCGRRTSASGRCETCARSSPPAPNVVSAVERIRNMLRFCRAWRERPGRGRKARRRRGSSVSSSLAAARRAFWGVARGAKQDVRRRGFTRKRGASGRRAPAPDARARGAPEAGRQPAW